MKRSFAPKPPTKSNKKSTSDRLIRGEKFTTTQQTQVVVTSPYQLAIAQALNVPMRKQVSKLEPIWQIRPDKVLDAPHINNIYGQRMTYSGDDRLALAQNQPATLYFADIEGRSNGQTNFNLNTHIS